MSEGQPRYRARARDCGIGFLSVSEGQPNCCFNSFHSGCCFLSVSEGQPVIIDGAVRVKKEFPQCV